MWKSQFTLVGKIESASIWINVTHKFGGISKNSVFMVKTEAGPDLYCS